jgi:hypothetical protein
MTAAANVFALCAAARLSAVTGSERYTHHGLCLGGNALHISHLAPNSATACGKCPSLAAIGE